MSGKVLWSRIRIESLVLLMSLLSTGIGSSQALSPEASDSARWEQLFDGKTLQNWKVTNFGGEGEVSIENGTLILGIGNDLTGITWTGNLPRVNYEILLSAKRLAGHDFFCGLTFPVEKSSCSLILGGWGGSVVGLSSIDGQDASENETSLMKRFRDDQWYAIRLRVTDQKIEAWIDQEKIIDFENRNRRLSIRSEVSPSQPFGIATWRTKAAIRGIQRRALAESDR
ncbi:MAG TPA: DUF1080 domain-containing protein [Terriglobia bacterium]|nr:DUF1080 domain-containing protein [Terriglobia bacterium]